MMTSIQESDQNNKLLLDSFHHFYQLCHVDSLLKRCRIEKKRGASTEEIFRFVFQLRFTGKNLYRTFHSKCHQGKISLIKPHTVYRFWKQSTFHWRKFLLLLSTRFLREVIQPLNNSDRVNVLILDDTLIKKPYSSHVEMLSLQRNHTSQEMEKGFPALTLGWSDGSTFVPLSFSLMSSKKYLVDSCVSPLFPLSPHHPSSLAFRRRIEAMEKKPDVALSMLKQAKTQNIQAQYVVFDSWFTNPAFLKSIQEEVSLDGIGMVKQAKTWYGYQGGHKTLSELYALCRKKQKPTKLDDKTLLYGSLCVSVGTLKSGEILYGKIVFVGNRNKKSKRVWLAILSTDVSLSDQEIIRIYGKRWAIEVFFKTIKSILQIEKEYQFRHFDSMVAYVTVAFCRYIYLAWLSRVSQDIRTCGALFFQACDELADIRLEEALIRLLQVLKELLLQAIPEVAEKIMELFTSFIKSLPSFLLRNLDFCMCKS